MFKVTHQEYARPGYQEKNTPFHPHSDNAIRGHERDGLHHNISLHGEPSKGYNTASYSDNKNPSRDNKIRGLPPHEKTTYGVSQNDRGKGHARNEYDSGGR